MSSGANSDDALAASSLGRKAHPRDTPGAMASARDEIESLFRTALVRTGI